MTYLQTAKVQDRVSGAEHRLKELIDDMHDIWQSSVDEMGPDSPVNLYAVDSDVVCMYMAPRDCHHYGALLRYDADARRDVDWELQELETKLVEFLGNLLFYQLQPACPPFLVADHMIELQKILTDAGDAALLKLNTWQSIMLQLKKSASEVTAVSRQALERAANMYEHGSTSGSMATTINALLNDIHNALRGGDAIGRLFRFDLLANSSRLSSLERVQLFNADGTESGFPTPINEQGEYIAPVARLAGRLLRRMKQLDVIRTPARNLTMKGDAVVLSHLAWLNEQLSEDDYYIKMGPGLRKIGKIFLITGSRLLPCAIKDLQINELEKCVISPLSLLGHRIMDEYMQSAGTELPPLVQHATGVSASSLINFCDSMRLSLANAIREEDFQRIAETLSKVRAEHSKLVESWQGQQLFGQHSRTGSVSLAIEELSEDRSQFERLAKLESFVQKLSIRAWQAFARSVTLLGFKKTGSSGMVQRNLPPLRLRLDEYPRANELVNKLYRYVHLHSLGQESEAPLNGAAILALTKEDVTHYTEFLCYALWALAHRLLRSAQGCAELALSIAEDEHATSPDASTRLEALYVRAHVMKLRATTLEELDQAKLGLQNELSNNISADGLTVLKFQSELFSIDCHCCYLLAFGRSSKSHCTPNQLLSTFTRGYALLQNLHETGDRSRTYTSEFVRHQILVNLAQVALLCKFGVTFKEDRSIGVYVPLDGRAEFAALEKQFEAVAEELEAEYRTLQAEVSGILPRPSVLLSCVNHAVSTVWRTGTSAQPECDGSIGQLGPVDAQRFEFLREVARYSRRQ